MAPTLVRLYLRRSLGHTRHVTAVRAREARGLVAEVYRQIERDFGVMAPPVGLHSPSPDLLAASWMILRETLVASGAADRASKELVATAVSAANSCPYCEDVHGMAMAGLTGADPQHDVGHRALDAWARRTPGTEPIPVSEAQAPEIIGTAVAFQYYNRMVNVFLNDSPLPPHVPENARSRAKRVLSWVLRPRRRGPRPGASVELLPPAPRRDELCWASPNPAIADAFARAYAAIDTTGARSVPERVRVLVLRRLSEWDGQPPGLSRAWVDEATADLPEADRSAGKLALVIAFASYQVDDDLVADVRRTLPGDRELVELAAWSSMAAARWAADRLATASAACV